MVANSWAAYSDDLVGLRLLLDAGAENKFQKKYSWRGTSAMAVAAHEGHKKVVDELLSEVFSINEGDVLTQAIGGENGSW